MLALALDLLLYAAISWVVLWAISCIISFSGVTDTVNDILQWSLAGTFFFIGLYVYYCAFEMTSWQATPGKRLVGLEVQSDKLKKPTPLQILTRNLCKPLFFYEVYEGVEPVANKKQKQLFHDELAHCVVIEKR